MEKDQIVYSHDGKDQGKLTGSKRLCSSQGGYRYMVRWTDGKWTWPHIRGMKFSLALNGWQIR